jgi:hypothetical protein
MGYIREAFEQVVANRKQMEPPKKWFVVLWEHVQYYGGPQEGGWYGWDHEPLEYAEFDDEETAHAVAKEVEKRAVELTNLSRRRHGERCLAELEWLDARGLDADYLPEADETSYSVRVEEELPKAVHGSRHYE